MALLAAKGGKAKGEYASMDLTSVVGTLESHWVVLDAELAEARAATAAQKLRVRRAAAHARPPRAAA